jgi:hypothetical protein
MFVETGTKNSTYLHQCYRLFSIESKPVSGKPISESHRQMLYEGCSQFIANEYFTGTYHIFESTFRVISEFYNKELYEKSEISVKNLFYDFMEIYMKETDQFANAPLCAFEYMRKIRNSMHNDGIFKEDKRNIREMCDFNGKKVKLEHNKPIEFEDLWKVSLQMTMWSYVVITAIISVPSVETAEFIPDPHIILN